MTWRLVSNRGDDSCPRDRRSPQLSLFGALAGGEAIAFDARFHERPLAHGVRLTHPDRPDASGRRRTDDL